MTEAHGRLSSHGATQPTPEAVGWESVDCPDEASLRTALKTIGIREGDTSQLITVPGGRRTAAMGKPAVGKGVGNNGKATPPSARP